MRQGNWQLCCPNCKAFLVETSNYFECLSCQMQYPIQGGVVCFNAEDNFYENRYPPLKLNFNPDDTRWYGKLSLYFSGMHYFWYIKKYVAENSRVLDLASGAGMNFLAKRYKTAGLEISISSASEMSKYYDLSIQCDAAVIPLKDSEVDAVVSRFFFEHVPIDEKMPILRECWRIIRPGGWLIILQDCECNNPLWCWARRDEELFVRNFINRDGHFGLIYPSQNLVLLEEAGFQLSEKYAANKTFLVTPSMIAWMQDYRQKGMLADFSLGLAMLFNRFRLANLGYSMIMTAWDDLVERLLPLDHARYLLTACQKPLEQ